MREPKHNKLQTCNCSCRPNSLSRTHSYAHIPLSIHTKRERESVCVCVLVATYVCQTRRSDTPADALEVWRWKEGNKCVWRQPVWRRRDHLHRLLNQAIVDWLLYKVVKDRAQKDRQEPPVYPKDWKHSVTRRVEKVHIPLCTHAQSVARSWFKNTRAVSCGPCWPAFMNTASSLQVNGP